MEVNTVPDSTVTQSTRTDEKMEVVCERTDILCKSQSEDIVFETGEISFKSDLVFKTGEYSGTADVSKMETEVVNLVIEDEEGDDDDDEEYVTMTAEEVREFLLKKISEFMKDPEFNPLLSLKKKILELQEKIAEKKGELTSLHKFLQLMLYNQEVFLRHMGIVPKPSNSVGITVDFPIFPNSVLQTPKENTGDSPKTVESSIKTEPNVSSSLTNSNQSGAISVPTKTSAQESSASEKTPPQPSASKPIEVIDLTSETETPNATISQKVAGPAKLTTSNSFLPGPSSSLYMMKHPAPLPPRPYNNLSKNLPDLPPKPRLKISSEDRGIVLQWDMPPHITYAKICNYEIFGYQELKNLAVSTALWKKIGCVKSLNLPMACTLTQFVEGYTYHFSIRAVDKYGRFGLYSDPISIVYNAKKTTA